MELENIIGIFGYKERTFEEIRESVVNDIQQIQPELVDLPDSLVSNLIDVGSVLIKQNEGLIKYLFNGISLPSVDDMFFDVVAQDYGMTRLPAAQAQLEMKITGTPGYKLAPNTKFSNANNTIIFYNKDSLIINSVGECSFTAYSDNLEADLNNVNIGDINKLLVSDANVLTVENKTIPTPVKDEETLQSFRTRIQERVRNIIQGTPDGLVSQLCSVEGVNPLQVNVVIGEQNIKGVKYNSIEAIVGQGDSADIAKVLMDYCGLNPRVLVSNPSKGETNRTIEQSVSYEKSSYIVKFTRPKILKLELIIKPKFRDILTTNTELELATTDKVINIFNNLSIRDILNRTFIEQMFINLMKEYGYKDSNIVSVDFEYKVDGSTGQLDPNGYFTEQEKDTVFNLDKYSILIQN